MRLFLWQIGGLCVLSCGGQSPAPDLEDASDPLSDTSTPTAEEPTTSTSVMPSFTVSPALIMSDNPDVPLVGVLSLTTDLPTTIQVEFRVGADAWLLEFDDLAEVHELTMLGFRPDARHELTVTATDADGATVTAAAPLVAETEPVPADFPVLELIASEPASMEPGATLMSAIDIAGVAADYIVVLDEHGTVVWFLRDEIGVTEIKRLRNGNLLYGRDLTQVLEVDLHGDVQRAWHTTQQADPVPGSVLVDIDYLHHDLVELPDGNLLTFALDTRVDPGYPTSEVDPQAPTESAWVATDRIVEFDATTGLVVYDLPAVDLLDPGRIGYDSVTSDWWSQTVGVSVRDWSHGNALYYDEASDHILASFRHQDAVIRVDRGTGQLQWILAPEANWGPEHAPYVLTPTGADYAPAYHSHSAELTPAGTVLLFDNGNHRASAFELPTGPYEIDSRAVEYAVDPVAMSATQVWQWDAMEEPNYASAMGDADVLPATDNALITYGALFFEPDAPSARVVEVTRGSDPTVVFQVDIARGWHVYRAQRMVLYPESTDGPTSVVAEPPPLPEAFTPDDQALSYHPAIIDPEFDIAGQQVLGVEAGGTIWVAAVDPVTGEIDPPDGRGEQVDDQAASTTTGNGPEWMYSDRGQEIVYARRFGATHHLARAWREGAGWAVEPIPNSDGLVAPIGSLTLDDPDPRIVSKAEHEIRAWWRYLSDPTDQLLLDEEIPWTPRWVEGTQQAVFAAPSGGSLQVFMLHADSGDIEQLTYEGTGVGTVYMWHSPSLDEKIMFGTLIDERYDAYGLAVFREIDGRWQVVKTILPPADFPYIGSPEYFVFDGLSYISYSTCEAALRSVAGHCGDSRVWISGVEPGNDVHRMVSDDTPMNRNDAESFASDSGAWVYYTDAPLGGIRRCSTGL